MDITYESNLNKNRPNLQERWDYLLNLRFMPRSDRRKKHTCVKNDMTCSLKPEGCLLPLK